MANTSEGYVLHTYGSERHLQRAVASAATLRRYDIHRPIALYCPRRHRQLLERHRLEELFHVIEPLPSEHRSTTGFKHHLYAFKPFQRSLYVDANVAWCRDPEPLWTRLRTYDFTALGLDRAGALFAARRGLQGFGDLLINRRDRTLRYFGLSHLPEVDTGLVYAADDALTEQVCEAAAHFLSRQGETHFRSYYGDGNPGEACAWSLAMAFSRLEIAILPKFDAYNSPQLNFEKGTTDFDPRFDHVRCRYYSSRMRRAARGAGSTPLRNALDFLASKLPGGSDYLEVTPYTLHFGGMDRRSPFDEFTARVWSALVKQERAVRKAREPRRLTASEERDPVKMSANERAVPEWQHKR